MFIVRQPSLSDGGVAFNRFKQLGFGPALTGAGGAVDFLLAFFGTLAALVALYFLTTRTLKQRQTVDEILLRLPVAATPAARAVAQRPAPARLQRRPPHLQCSLLAVSLHIRCTWFAGLQGIPLMQCKAFWNSPRRCGPPGSLCENLKSSPRSREPSLKNFRRRGLRLVGRSVELF